MWKSLKHRGATPKADAKTVETTINDNDPPSVPQMAAGSEPGSIDITPVAGTKALVVHYTDENAEQHTLKVNRNDSGKWESADDLPESVNLDAASGKLTLGAKAVADGSEVKAHNDSESTKAKPARSSRATTTAPTRRRPCSRTTREPLPSPGTPKWAAS